MADHDTPEDVLDRLSARCNMPELPQPLPLPDDWRADLDWWDIRDPDQHCMTCHWDGRWDQLIRVHGERTADYKDALNPDALQESASASRCLCCALFLALSRKFDVTGGRESKSVHFSPLDGLKVGDQITRIKDVYMSCHDGPSPAPQVSPPPGATVYPHGRHPRFIDPRSDESLAWAKSHIENCLNSHNCDAFRSKGVHLPTRLVHIPKDVQTHGVRILRGPDISSLPPGTRYAALSHCWGQQTPPCLTTVETMEEYSTGGIPWAQFPKIFRHAMLYAQRLDLEYIWIDSLCIVQGDDEDWKRESMRMFQYYSNAYITLASTFAVDCHGGFFSERHINATRLHLLDVRYRGKTYPVYAFRDFPEGDAFNFYEYRNVVQRLGNAFQLFRRAWVYQERLVSPRLLYFTEKQLLFECYGGRWFQETSDRASETRRRKYMALLLSSSSSSSSSSNNNNNKNTMCTSCEPAAEEEEEEELPQGSWTDILGAYGSLQITRPRDKLPAIAAVAKQFLSHQAGHRLLPHAPEHEYLCGLRRSHLHTDLSWAAECDPHVAVGHYRAPGAARGYLAPSWSWASVPGETTYGSETLCRGAESTIALVGERLVFAGEGGGDRFGPVLAGSYITIEGPVLECVWDAPPDDDVLEFSHARSSRVTQVTGLDSAGKLDFWPDYADSHRYVEGHIEPGGRAVKKLMLLQTWISVDGEIIGFLVLYRNAANDRYRRLGAGMCSYHKYMADWHRLKSVCEQAERRSLEME